MGLVEEWNLSVAMLHRIFNRSTTDAWELTPTRTHAQVALSDAVPSHSNSSYWIAAATKADEVLYAWTAWRFFARAAELGLISTSESRRLQDAAPGAVWTSRA